MGFRWKLIFAFVALFLIGGICGSIVTRGYIHSRPDNRGPRLWQQLLVHHLTARLNLTPDQRTGVQNELNNTFRDIDSIHRRTIIESDQLIDNALGRIEVTLTPQQQAEMEKIRAGRRLRTQRLLRTMPFR